MKRQNEIALFPIDADKVADKVVSVGLDIAPTRMAWERLARAIVMLAAGDGREAFHRMAAVWPDYNRHDSELCYNRAERTGGDRDDARWLWYRLRKTLHIDIFGSPYRSGSMPIAVTVKNKKNDKIMIERKKIMLDDITPTLLGEKNLLGLSQLTDLLARLFPQGKVIEAVNRYLIGFKSLTTGVPGGEIIFWQVNEKQEIINGKAIKYGFDGHRDKKVPPRLLYAGNGMCLFGEHLLPSWDKVVGLVESEKSALIMSIARPELLWVATGSLSNFNERMLSPLRGRLVLAFPDLDVKRGKRTNRSVTYEQWMDKAVLLNCHGFKIGIDKSLEEKANYPMRADKMDVADVAIEEAKQQLFNIK